MKQRIAEWLWTIIHWLYPPTSPMNEFVLLKQAIRGSVRVRVFHTRMRCAGFGCCVELSCPQGDEWAELGCIYGEDDIHDAAVLLHAASRFVHGIEECTPEPDPSDTELK